MLLASFKLNDGTLKYKQPILKLNRYTILVLLFDKVVKRHVVKHNVSFIDTESNIYLEGL